jgi:hypothetical protein
MSEILMDIAENLGYRVMFSSCPSNHRLKAAHQPGQVQKMCLKAAHQPGQIQNMRVHAGNKRGRVPLGKPQLALNAIPQKEQKFISRCHSFQLRDHGSKMMFLCCRIRENPSGV